MIMTTIVMGLEMPIKKTAEVDKAEEGCILRNGKANNVIQWQDEMYTLATGLYGPMGMFFKTGVSYFHPTSTLQWSAGVTQTQPSESSTVLPMYYHQTQQLIADDGT